MANQQKSSKKIATKAAKTAGVPKVPRYMDREASVSPDASKAPPKGN